MTLVVVHLFYFDLWPELADCIRNIGACDLVVTYLDESAVTRVRRDFPAAKCVRVENRGFDAWPFIKVLQDTDLSAYDVIVKLHTKRDYDFDVIFNGRTLSGGDWREHLLSFCRTPEAWRQTRVRLANPRVGMVGGHGVVVARSGIPAKRLRRTFDRARREIEETTGRRLKGGRFVAGTMFAARPEALAALKPRRFAAEQFPLHQLHTVETYAHRCERMFGLAVQAADLEVVECDRGLTAMRIQTRLRMILRPMGRFFYQRKRTLNGYLLVKICKIPVFRKRIPSNPA